MKKIIATAHILFITIAVFGQSKGTVYYQETRKLHFNIQGNAPPPPNLPTENKNFTVLYFNEGASLYKNDETKQSDPMTMDEESGEGERMIIKMSVPDNRVYCDLENKFMIRQEDFMQRKFLVEVEIKSAGWKITGNQKTILNYSCMEAVREDSLGKTIVWFTPAIPVSTGPQKFAGLPGLVLEAILDDGEQIITATLVTNELDEKMIEKPKDGKKVTDEEYNAIVDEKMKEMGVDRGNGGNIIIKIDDH